MDKSLCESQSIVDGIEAIDNNADQINYIKNILVNCGSGQTLPAKKKRPISGYNCYVKAESKKGNKNVIKSRSWSQLKQKAKEEWNREAKKGCLPKLWKGD